MSAIEEIFEYNSAKIGDDIDDLQYWAGQDVMTKQDFEKATNELLTELRKELDEMIEKWDKELKASKGIGVSENYCNDTLEDLQKLRKMI